MERSVGAKVERMVKVNGDFEAYLSKEPILFLGGGVSYLPV